MILPDRLILVSSPGEQGNFGGKRTPGSLGGKRCKLMSYTPKSVGGLNAMVRITKYMNGIQLVDVYKSQILSFVEYRTPAFSSWYE